MQIGNLVFEKEELLKFESVFHTNFTRCFEEIYYSDYQSAGGKLHFWYSRISEKEASRIITFFSHQKYGFLRVNLTIYIMVIQAMAHYLVDELPENDDLEKPTLRYFLKTATQETYAKALLGFYSKTLNL